ncbi:MAG: AI-2E family transporter [Clostridiales bacterium]|nr:AI-2E family transporter [Clostridiales bacterium]
MGIQPASRGLTLPWRRAAAIGAILGGVLLIRPLSKLLWQIGFALLLAAMAAPLAQWMEKKLSRGVATGLAVAALVVSVLGMIGLLVPHIITQVSQLIGQLPRLLSLLQGMWTNLSQQPWMEGLQMDKQTPEKLLAQAAGWIANGLPKILSSIGTGVDFISRAFLSPILAYYFLRDREAFSYRLSLWIPLKHRKRMLTALMEMRREAGGYVRGQLLVALAVAVLTAAGLMIVGIPAWLVLGLVMGVCELIPYIGPLIGAVPIVLFSLSQGWSATLWALGVAIAVQQAEGYFLSPRLMAGATGLHPAYILMLLTAGGLLWGLAGMMLALPVFVCLRGAFRVLYATREKTNVKSF